MLYFGKELLFITTDVSIDGFKIVALLPNDNTLSSTQQVHLNIPTLPTSVTKAHAFPNLAVRLLISIGQLYNAGCEAYFTKQNPAKASTKKQSTRYERLIGACESY